MSAFFLHSRFSYRTLKERCSNTKYEYRNPKQIQNANVLNQKLNFAQFVIPAKAGIHYNEQKWIPNQVWNDNA